MVNSDKNRMHAHNIAIVFGPTLLSPREEHHSSIALNTVYQNQIVEFILLEYDQVLGKDNWFVSKIIEDMCKFKLYHRYMNVQSVMHSLKKSPV
jgi:hypothetical protein